MQEHIKLVHCRFFSPKRIEANKKYELYTKMNVSAGNADKYISAIQLGVIATYINKVYINQGSNGDQYLEVSNLDPPQTTYRVDLPIPYISNGAFKVYMLSLSAPKIWTSTARYSGSVRDNTAQWSFFVFPSQMEWTNGSAASTIGGVVGKCNITYYYNRSYDYNVSVYGTGYTEIGFNTQVGASSGVGSFEVESPRITHNIVVDAI